MPATVLVTGAKGCIGAWTLRALLDAGHRAISLDLPGNMHRLNLILGDDLARVTLLDGDILDADLVTRTVQEQGITNIVHLAALQVPAARAKPTLGAQINVVGTVNVFEAARAAGIKHLAYASSIAAYSPDMTFEPRTLYGVWKLANEGTARVYQQDQGIGSIAMRPYTVYGLGRDFGVTSAPTAAMLAAAAGQGYHIPFGGRMLYHSGRDIGALFMRAALATDFGRAAVYNPPGTFADTKTVIAAINAAAPDVTITYDDVTLPFPSDYDTRELEAALGSITMTPLEAGVAETVSGFRRALANGTIEAPKPAA
jgi:UDP-glucuronate 4-epimerase